MKQSLLFDDGSDLPLFAGTAYGPPAPVATWDRPAVKREEYRQPTIGLCVRCFASVEDTEVLCETCRLAV